MVEVIADSIVGEVSQFLRVQLPQERYVLWLTARAEGCLQHDPSFRRKMKGAASREWLRTFSRHWLASLLRCERPDLLQYLPDTFDLGRPLPHERLARVRRRDGIAPRKAMRWNAARVLAHPQWRRILAA